MHPNWCHPDILRICWLSKPGRDDYDAIANSLVHKRVAKFQATNGRTT